MLVLQHIACEPPAAYEDELRAWDLDLHRVQLDEGDPLPDWRDFAAIIAMGGPMGALDDARCPWLRAERVLIHDAVRAGTPFWGVCLGAQLLAASLGAHVHPGPAPEVGMLPVSRTAAARQDPVFRHLPDEFETLQWHNDTYELPAGATQLARSDAYAQQAFVVERAYGLQFHLEVTAGLATEWGRWRPTRTASRRCWAGARCRTCSPRLRRPRHARRRSPAGCSRPGSRRSSAFRPRDGASQLGPRR